MDVIVGIVIGLLLYYVFGERKKTSGAFIIDLIDDRIEFKMTESLEDIAMKKSIWIKVEVREDDSQQ